MAAEESAAPLLACRGVCKNFGALAAVKDLSFEVRRGETLGIGGPNGAGKTTLFEVISGLNRADSGQILFRGQDLAGRTPERICHLGIARTFQLNAGFDTLTAIENVLVAGQYGVRNRTWPNLAFAPAVRRRARETLDRVGMAERADSIVRHLPVLDRKRLMVATALMTEPSLLLLDEPVGGLNAGEIDAMMALIGRLPGEGVTLILIEHVMRFLVQLSSRVLIMHHGEKIYEGSADGLVRDRTVIEVYLGEGASHSLAHLLADKATRHASPAGA
jgi:branched-chain amino acid transport system ATP-binding protein